MAKINFTQEHFEKLKAYAVEMLFTQETVITKLGQTLNIVELLHTTTINTLNSIRLQLAKEIETIENQDEWVSGEVSQRKLDSLKAKKELVNLIIGYKRFIQEQTEIARERASLEDELVRLKESQKTPEDKIKEIESKLETLTTTTF
jgi:chromosome segregation ATPase